MKLVTIHNLKDCPWTVPFWNWNWNLHWICAPIQNLEPYHFGIETSVIELRLHPFRILEPYHFGIETRGGLQYDAGSQLPWTVPFWNWNEDFTPNIEAICSTLNRTILELKLNADYSEDPEIAALNRTILELKLVHTGPPFTKHCPLNRTILELKPKHWHSIK